MNAAEGTQLGLVFRSKCDVRLEHVPVPVIEQPTDVIVRVELCGLCGSDLHPWACREKGLDAGTICGHEFVGIVSEVGGAVRRWGRGDRVMSPFTTCCGACFYCRRGLTARCTEAQLFGWVEGGRGLQGAQAQWVRVPLADSTLAAVPEGVTAEEALLLGDVFSTGFFAAENAGIGERAANAGRSTLAASSGEREGEGAEGADEPPVVAVVGCGPVGLMAVVGAAELGAAAIFAVDCIPERLALAERFGAAAVDLRTCEVRERVRSATGGRGADAVIEAVGTPAAFQLACDLARPGGVVSSCGCHTEASVPMADLYNKNLTLKSGRCPARAYIDRLLPIVLSKRHDITAIITHRLPLQAEAYEMFAARADGCIKVVFSPWASLAPWVAKREQIRSVEESGDPTEGRKLSGRPHAPR